MKKILTTIMILALVVVSHVGFGQQAKYQAAFIFHFTKYVSWPSGSGDFVIGVMGDTEMENQLKALSQAKSVGNRTIKVMRISNATDAAKCNLVMLGKAKSSQLASIQNVASSNHILVVTNNPGLGKKGAGINFVLKNGKQLFEVNKGAIEKAGLQASPKLLQLGIPV